MAQIVLGIGVSHTPMLNGAVEDWPRFVEVDRRRNNLDKQGDPVSYDELLRLAGDGMAEKIRPEKLAARHAAAMGNLERIRGALRDAALDALIVVGDDQDELFDERNSPCVLVYHGERIPNLPPEHDAGAPEWRRRLMGRYCEESVPRDYPVHAALARHLIETLIDREFDVACASAVPPGKGEGHAFGFVHKRLMQGAPVPVVPVFLNTYVPPNVASPRRCYRLGQAIAAAVTSYPGDARIGVLASGGLSHFTVDEELDGEVLRALREKDAAALQALPPKKLQAGSSEIRNWICAAGALERLPISWTDYQPGYRTPAGTGTGLGFAIWS